MSTKPKSIILPIGFNALFNDAEKTALILGEYKTPSKAFTALSLVNRKTEAELMSAIPAGYTPVYPAKPTA